MAAPVLDTKEALRRTALRARRALDPEERRDASARVAHRAMELPELRGLLRSTMRAGSDDPAVRTPALTVLAYAAMDDELDPAGVVAELRDRGARLLYPRVRGPMLELAAAPVGSPLTIGYRGVREPTGPAIDPEVVDLALVPGVAFDVHGGRLGHGGGHYDRLLARLPSTCLTIGVAHACQVVPRVPTEAHDRGVDLVVTDAGVHRAPSA